MGYVFLFNYIDLISLFNYDYFNLDINLFQFFGESEGATGGNTSNSTNSNTNLSPLQDPAKIWPTGLPQGYGPIGAGLMVYTVLTKVGGLVLERG